MCVHACVLSVGVRVAPPTWQMVLHPRERAPQWSPTGCVWRTIVRGKPSTHHTPLILLEQAQQAPGEEGKKGAAVEEEFPAVPSSLMQNILSEEAAVEAGRPYSVHHLGPPRYVGRYAPRVPLTQLRGRHTGKRLRGRASPLVPSCTLGHGQCGGVMVV